MSTVQVDVMQDVVAGNKLIERRQHSLGSDRRYRWPSPNNSICLVTPEQETDKFFKGKERVSLCSTFVCI